jgi:hypothetical protein
MQRTTVEAAGGLNGSFAGFSESGIMLAFLQ